MIHSRGNMKPKAGKVNRKTLDKQLRQLTADNGELGTFAAGLIGKVTAVHEECMDMYKNMRFCILPGTRRMKRTLYAVCSMLGPYLIDIRDKDEIEAGRMRLKPGEKPKPKGQEDASNSERDTGNTPDSGNRVGDDSDE